MARIQFTYGETKQFPTGTLAHCNRCDAAGHTDRPSEGKRENAGAYRLQGFTRLECGHSDCHWVYVADPQ